jgi:4-amino-4-deoxy-L-arabinose transferase-like glycosyltransferase
MANGTDAAIQFAQAVQKAKAGDPAAQKFVSEQLQKQAVSAAPQSGSILMYFVYAVIALVSPWFWILALIGWPIAAYLLPRSTDEDGKEHWRWRPAGWIALAVSYLFAYMMVAAGFAMLPSVLKIASAASGVPVL